MLFWCLRNIIVNWYFIFSITAIIRVVVTEINVTRTEYVDDSRDCVKAFNKTGHYSLEIKEKCDKYNVILNFETSTSIINLTIFIRQNEDWTNNTSNSTFKIRLYEPTVYYNTDKEENILFNEWHENADAIPCSRNYLSRSSRVLIEISGTGNWSCCEIDFFFDEIEYRIEERMDVFTEDEDPMGVLNSSLICFYYHLANSSRLIKEITEFEKDKYKGFETFRGNFAKTAKDYLPTEYKTIDLNKQSIDLFGSAKRKTINDSDVLFILVKVMYKKRSIFTWSKLQIIIKKYEETDTDVLGYKVGICPRSAPFDLPYNDGWSIVFYALVPVLGLFALMMWAWKHNLFSQNCLTEKEEKLSFGFPHAEPNEYGMTMTIPKICRYEDEGRRNTLIQGSSQEDRGYSENSTMVEMAAIPLTSEDTLSHFLSGQRRKSRASLKNFIDNAEENKRKSQTGKTEGNESDHLYDSLNRSQQLGETKL